MAMQNDPSSSETNAADPAAIWWSPQQPRVQTAAQSQLEPVAVKSEWRWSYSRWFGIMYGPVPVGIIIGIPLLLLLHAI